MNNSVSKPQNMSQVISISPGFNNQSINDMMYKDCGKNLSCRIACYIEKSPFELSEFEIIQSDLTDKKSHIVAITYTTGACTLLQHFGEYLLLSGSDQNNAEEWRDTFLVKRSKNFSIIGNKEKKLPLVVVNY